ncbi:glycine cleavage system protein H [Alkalilimnicola ehrlichii]|uniref:Glycine cleavage system H protein n=1 Tax=Alkalilimnicola ehrlichii TaxID=351052 RepID=A0A3E0X3P0_9GAMM|nr:glycine cleavage system protein GcvH [Alkalilimnicola ehrlichii]RFA31262.1 glycine cleavage system protein H [Alkalilimnicola ehrlichii]RFA39462.1 glycine cleavage system protein H [Alkalilimnicola ehrlichii]
MSNLPSDLKYADTHEWARLDDDGLVTVGITDYAQESLGDLVFVETPVVGNQVSAKDACAVVESVKAASDIYAPVSGEIVDANALLNDSPELINSDPYGDGWIMRIRPDETAELDELLSAEEYEAQVSADE